ncbi:hypothetical protein D9M70_442270 [compost metagenome]
MGSARQDAHPLAQEIRHHHRAKLPTIPVHHVVVEARETAEHVNAQVPGDLFDQCLGAFETLAEHNGDAEEERHKHDASASQMHTSENATSAQNGGCGDHEQQQLQPPSGQHRGDHTERH